MLNNLKILGVAEKPYIANACLKANFTCPSIHINGGLCGLLQKRDLVKLTADKNSEQVDECEMIMSQARDLLSKAGSTTVQQTHLHGTLAGRLVLFMVGKSADGKSYASLGEIVHDPHQRIKCMAHGATALLFLFIEGSHSRV